MLPLSVKPVAGFICERGKYRHCSLFVSTLAEQTVSLGRQASHKRH